MQSNTLSKESQGIKRDGVESVSMIVSRHCLGVSTQASYVATKCVSGLKGQCPQAYGNLGGLCRTIDLQQCCNKLCCLSAYAYYLKRCESTTDQVGSEAAAWTSCIIDAHMELSGSVPLSAHACVVYWVRSPCTG